MAIEVCEDYHCMEAIFRCSEIITKLEKGRLIVGDQSMALLIHLNKQCNSDANNVKLPKQVSSNLGGRSRKQSYIRL